MLTCRFSEKAGSRGCALQTGSAGYQGNHRGPVLQRSVWVRRAARGGDNSETIGAGVLRQGDNPGQSQQPPYPAHYSP